MYSNPTVSFTPYTTGSSAPTAPSLPTSTYTTTNSGSGSSSSGSNLSKGAIAGIVIGCSIGFGLLCALLTVFLMMQTRRRDDGGPVKRQYQPNSENSKIEGATEDSRRGEGGAAALRGGGR